MIVLAVGSCIMVKMGDCSTRFRLAEDLVWNSGIMVIFDLSSQHTLGPSLKTEEVRSSRCNG